MARRSVNMRINKRRATTWLLLIWALTMTGIVLFSGRCLPSLDGSNLAQVPPGVNQQDSQGVANQLPGSEDQVVPPGQAVIPTQKSTPQDTRPGDYQGAVAAVGKETNPKGAEDEEQEEVHPPMSRNAKNEEDPKEVEEPAPVEDEVKDEVEARAGAEEPKEQRQSTAAAPSTELSGENFWVTLSPSSSSSSSSALVSLTFELAGPNSCISYSVKERGKDLVAPSKLLFATDFEGKAKAICGLKILSETRSSFDETWRPFHGQHARIRNRYEETQVVLGKTKAQPVLRIDARVYDEGLGFRIVLLGLDGSPLLPDDLTRDVSLVFTAVINMDVGVDGNLYQDLSGENGFAVHRLSEETNVGWPYDLPMHPFTVQYDDARFFAFTESSNTEFETVRFAAPSGSFKEVTANFKWKDMIAPDRPSLQTPWFTFIIGNSPGDLIERAEGLVYNLNEPCAIRDPSWIRPGKVFRDLPLSTESSMAAIDLAVKINLQHILLDAGWYGPEHDSSSDATKWLPQPKSKPLDLKQVIAHGKTKKVGVFLYVNDIALKRQFDKIAPLYASWGVAGIKFGFVQLGSSKDTARLMSYVRTCAKHKLLVNIHDNFRPSGYSRTYPNLVSIEGIRGDEHQESPTHGMILPFVRYLGGVADNTFVYDEQRLQKMGKSVIHQVALTIIYYNPLQHLFWYRDPWSILKIFRDLQPSLRHLLVWKDLPAMWEDTKVIASEIGEFIVMARKNSKGDWFVASASKDARDIAFSLDFLDSDASYQVERFQDNPDSLFSGAVPSKDSLDLKAEYRASLVAGGGDVVVFRRTVPATYTESKVDAVNLISLATGESDSRLFGFPKDPRHYSVCTMFNVCVNADRIFLMVDDDQERNTLNTKAVLCENNSPQKPEFCRCFARSLKPTFVKNLAEIGTYHAYSGHTWISDHWVNIHQIGHWVEKMVQFHSIFLSPESYALPKVDRIAFIKSPEMNIPEAFFYHLGTGNLGYTIPENPLFKISVPICMERASGTGLTATMSTSLADMTAFRETTNRLAQAKLPISDQPESFCPPPKTFILQRTEPAGRLRRMLNQDKIEELLKSKFGLVDISVITTNSSMSVIEQVDTFGQYGLMLASHSSQLVFGIFSQPNAAVIEVASTYFNSDFSSIAQKAGLFYRFALGGEVPEATSSNGLDYCNSKFADCVGLPECIEKNVICSKTERGDFKEFDFRADIDEVTSAVSQALDHLHKACEGHWKGAAQPARK